ncbi:c-type cytochrome, partial [Pararhodobacter oceanensis]|uniref:c-type cytochrome n=1 Tax=Pararhodobacter oceanensis TaxID=2172121 RepID=UPI003A921A2C
MLKNAALSTLAALTMGLSGTAAFAGDPAAGEREWRGCRSCHALTDDEGNQIQRGGRSAPNLYGIPGAAVASADPDFGYSDPLLAYAETGAVWNEELFVEYVTDPTAFLRHHLGDDSVRSAMTYRMRRGAEDMWAYLESVSPAVGADAAGGDMAEGDMAGDAAG